MNRLALHQLWSSILDLLYPPRCIGCQEVGAWFCDTCLGQVQRVRPPLCSRCGRSLARPGPRLCSHCKSTSSPIERVRSAAYSEGVLREAIHTYKYEGVTALVPPLAGLMVEYCSRHPVSAEVMVPVPLHKRRVRKRGFNQAALLAHELARHIDVTVDETILERHRRTAPQVELDVAQRRENVQGAFRCVSRGAADRSVLLIDDVCTTGSTLEACAEALAQGGARSVRALTLARAR